MRIRRPKRDRSDLGKVASFAVQQVEAEELTPSADSGGNKKIPDIPESGARDIVDSERGHLELTESEAVAGG
jgi:hypothetical protein